MLPYPACQLPITACSVRRLRELPWAALVYVVCQAQRPIPSPSPVRPERRCSRQDPRWLGSVWNVFQAGIPLFLGTGQIVCFLLNPHSVRPHQFDLVLEFFALSTLCVREVSWDNTGFNAQIPGHS